MLLQTYYVKAGSTSVTIDVTLAKNFGSGAPGDPITGLAYNTASLHAYYRNGATATPVAITLVTQTVGGAWSSGGFVQIDSTNHAGLYRFDVPNAAIPSTVGQECTISFDGAANLGVQHVKIVASQAVDVVSTAGVSEVARITGTAAGGGSNYITFTASTVTNAQCPVGGTVRIVSGTGAFQWMPVASVTAAGGYVTQATGPSGWTWPVTNAAAGSVYQIDPGPGISPASITDVWSDSANAARTITGGNVSQMNSVSVIGAGTVASPWRGA